MKVSTRRETVQGNRRITRAPPQVDRAKLNTYGYDLQGRRISVWWDGDSTWFHGNIVQFSGTEERHLVKYDDGETKWHDIAFEESQDYIKWDPESTNAKGKSPPATSIKRGKATESKSAPPRKRQASESATTQSVPVHEITLATLHCHPLCGPSRGL